MYQVGHFKLVHSFDISLIFSGLINSKMSFFPPLLSILHEAHYHLKSQRYWLR